MHTSLGSFFSKARLPFAVLAVLAVALPGESAFMPPCITAGSLGSAPAEILPGCLESVQRFVSQGERDKSAATWSSKLGSSRARARTLNLKGQLKRYMHERTRGMDRVPK